MASARPLRDVFAGLTGDATTAGDARALLDGSGHADLPDDLIAEAVVSYADTAPVEVAEQLAPYVTAHSVVGPDPDDAPAGDWTGLDFGAGSGVVPEDDIETGETVPDEVTFEEPSVVDTGADWLELEPSFERPDDTDDLPDDGFIG